MTKLLPLDNADRRSLRLIQAHLAEHNPGTVLGLYLYGSTISRERGPDSDLDLLLITRASLGKDERQALTGLLLELSGWSGHAHTDPEAATRRPIELTSIAIGDEHPATHHSGHDYQYGEWLRSELYAGAIPEPQYDPDTPILLATAQSGHQRLHGAALSSLVSTIPEAMLRRAGLEVIPTLFDELTGDERNVLLTLARIAFTSSSGRIVSKSRAADWAAARLTTASEATLLLARAEYLGEASVDWTARHEAVLQAAREIVELARER
ncbi:aminoglycoside adenylyltransferase domain-containing protein [Leucobacter sp. GX24907]